MKTDKSSLVRGALSPVNHKDGQTDIEKISTLKKVVPSDIGLYLNVKPMKNNFRQNVLAYMLQSSVNSKQAS